ncbi:hypothetical protein F8388_023599, partial [Cannabis sativa]
SKKKKKRSLSSSFFGDDDDEQEQDLSPTFHPYLFSGRDVVPSHFLLKIDSFHSLSKSSAVAYYSSEFETGGYKWQLTIFPNGDIYNGNARVMRFHSMRTKWVIPKYIELKTFNDDSNGYLVNESCAFGAEVFVVKNTFKGECLSMIVDPIETIHTWKFDAISTKNQERYESDPFVGGAYKWRILVYPNGLAEGKGTHISLFLQLEISSLPPDTKLFVRYVLRLNNQTNYTNRNNFETKGTVSHHPVTNGVFDNSCHWQSLNT